MAAFASSGDASAEDVLASDSCSRRKRDGGKCWHNASIWAGVAACRKGIVVFEFRSSGRVVKDLSWDCCWGWDCWGRDEEPWSERRKFCTMVFGSEGSVGGLGERRVLACALV